MSLPFVDVVGALGAHVGGQLGPGDLLADVHFQLLCGVAGLAGRHRGARGGGLDPLEQELYSACGMGRGGEGLTQGEL